MNRFETKNKNSSASDTVQPKLKVGRRGDRYEQEADAMADKVMMMPESETIRMQPKDKEEENRENEEQQEEGMTWEEIGQSIAEALISHPKILARECINRINAISALMTKRKERCRYYITLQEISTKFLYLSFYLSNNQGQTTEEQKKQFKQLQKEWDNVQKLIEKDDIEEFRRNLRSARREIEKLKMKLVLVYRQVYLSGEDSTTKITISKTNEETTTLRSISDQVTGLLSAINEADAGLTGRQVAPLLKTLSGAYQFFNLILGWNFTGKLDSASQSAFDDLQNAVAAGFTAASFTAASAYLPLFGHIPVLLGAISNQWDRVVEGLRKENTEWWEFREEMPYCSEEPGGCNTLSYMARVFHASSYEDVPTPPEDVADFFLDRRDMFNSVATEVMDDWKVPTRKKHWYSFFTSIDDENFKAWIYFNREWVWKLIYGKRSFPKKRR